MAVQGQRTEHAVRIIFSSCKKGVETDQTQKLPGTFPVLHCLMCNLEINSLCPLHSFFFSVKDCHNIMSQIKWLKHQKCMFCISGTWKSRSKPSAPRSPSPHLENGDTTPSVFVGFFFVHVCPNLLFKRESSYMTWGPTPEDLMLPWQTPERCYLQIQTLSELSEF